MAEKTEAPTPRRLRRAREQGDSPVSRVLAQSVGFLIALALLPALVRATSAAAAADLVGAIESGTADPAAAAWRVLVLSVPWLAAVAATGAAVSFVQTGGAFALGRLAPDLSRLNPLEGLRSLWSSERVFTLVRALLAAGAVGYLCWRVALDRLGEAAATAGNWRSALPLALDATQSVLWGAAVVGLVLGAVDALFVRRAWLRRHRMSHDEIRREHRENEGDPEVKAARRRAHQEALAGASIAAVKTASVLIVNPTHLATALRYDEAADDAPTVVAQGEGDLARRLVEAAHQYGVPVVRDVPVARALRELPLGEQIPEALYEAVAEILREIAGEPPEA